MITIEIIGLDHFVVGQYSREHLDNLAQLFETEAGAINFVSTENVLLHNGVEQTSWNALVHIKAAAKFEPFEKAVAEYLMTTLKTFAINVVVEFFYYHNHSHYESIHPTYPRYIEVSQVKDITFEEEEHDHCHEDEEAEAHDDAELDPQDEAQIYLGNAFEGFEEKLQAAQKKEDK